MDKTAKVAYFSMEIMIRTNIPTYAGGLGILAGDLLRSCADMKVPAVGVTLVYNGDAFKQTINPDGSQTYEEMIWRKNDQFVRLPTTITLTIDGQEIIVGCWRHTFVGYSGFVVPVYLLDTDHYKNEPWKRRITENLYGGDGATRICQEIVLGIGGVKMLRALGYNDIDIFHMNEGHSSFATLGLLPEVNYQDEEVRKKCVFTTHTPIPEGHDKFNYDLAWKYAGAYLPWHIKKIAGEDMLNMTVLGLSESKYSFGVSQKHGEVSQRMFPDFKVHAITNGVHHRTWIASTKQDVYNEYMPEWLENPSALSQAPDKLPDDAFWKAHLECKKVLVDLVNKHLTSPTSQEDQDHPEPDELFDVDTLTISLARRPVPYKRPLLIYHDLERLVRLSVGKIQIIQAGKAHPDDTSGRNIIKQILELSKKLKGIVRIVYLENYSPTLARLLVSGCDVWLNTPMRPLEASGTSGMKAAMNGVLNFSILDGWWIEGYARCPKSGFSIGENNTSNDDTHDANDMYDKLENEIIPMYYENRGEWIKRMKYAITLGAYFNTHRCIEEYREKAWGI